jgi:predicted TPR repeat methyltransferase
MPSSPAENHFDARAATWDDDPAKWARAEAVAGVIRATVPLGPSVRMLEYGAGTGMVTQALRDAVGPVTMVDTSAGMREVMERKIAAGAITGARVWDVDLATEAAPDERFDLVVTVLTLHHVADIDPLLSRFADLLVESGHLCIVDLEEEDGSVHAEGFAGHHGFARDTLSESLLGAGFTDVRFQPCHEIVRDGVAYPLFLATAVRRDAAGG